MIIDKFVNSILLLGVTARRHFAYVRFVIGAVALLVFINCAYYNTFYNAEKYYKDGLNKQKTNPSAAKSSFTKAIEKSALVITNYPTSKYTHQALFVIGVSYYYTGEYAKAISKFENLLLVFPNSKFIPEANLYWAACLIETKEYNAAIERLQNLKQISLQKALPKALDEIALYKTAELYYVKKDYEQAERELKNFVSKYPKSEYQKDALLMLGDAERELKNYSDAITTYETYLKKLKEKSQLSKADTASERIQGVLRLAECLIESERQDEGLKILDEITGIDTMASKQTKLDAKAYLELGKLFLRINDPEKSRVYLKKVRTSPDIIEALYMLGNSYESESKFDTAKAYYDSVVIRRTDNEVTTLAQSRLELLKLVVAPPTAKKDTTPIKKDTLVVKKDTLEKYPELPLPDSFAFDSLPLPEDTISPDFIDTLKQVVTDTIKPTIKDTVKPKIEKDTTSPVDSAAVQFHLAEIYNLNLKKYERALTEYEKVYERYPKSNFAPKALFAEAWIYKNILGAQADTSQYNSNFKRTLNTIINKYPNTEYATAARNMLRP